MKCHFLKTPKYVCDPSAYNLQPKFTVLIEVTFVSFSNPLLLEIFNCQCLMFRVFHSPTAVPFFFGHPFFYFVYTSMISLSFVPFVPKMAELHAKGFGAPNFFS